MRNKLLIKIEDFSINYFGLIVILLAVLLTCYGLYGVFNGWNETFFKCVFYGILFVIVGFVLQVFMSFRMDILE